MLFDISLYASLAVFALGMVYRVSTWFRYNVSGHPESFSTAERLRAALAGIASTFLSRKIFTLIKVLFLDVLLLRRTLKEDFFRWFMHIFIFYGFMLLLLMHALDGYITSNLFAYYQPTLNPYLFLRDLAGGLVVLGVLIALARRFIVKPPRLKTRAVDVCALFLLGVIIASGVLLKGSKIVSYESFERMVNEYAFLEDEAEMEALAAYWTQEYGLAAPGMSPPFDREKIREGRELAEMSCLDCHSKPKWAFLSYRASRALEPVARELDRAGLPQTLWYIHFLSCFIGLAYLPFSKMFHIFSGPLSLLANSVMDEKDSLPANLATKRVLELDACTRCGACSVSCRVGVAFEEMGNINILPSEKIGALKALAAGRNLGEQTLKDLLEGVYLCTNCYRCTAVCPVGINLQELWFGAREALLEKGHPEFLALTPFSFYRGCLKERIPRGQYSGPPALAREAIARGFEGAYARKGQITPSSEGRELRGLLRLSFDAATFSHCYNCKTCTTACPVVRNYDNPREALGLVPHQIMHAAAFGFMELVLESNMLWACLGCYQCQEHCPQGVGVADVLYELKNLAIRQVKKNRDK